MEGLSSSVRALSNKEQVALFLNQRLGYCVESVTYTPQDLALPDRAAQNIRHIEQLTNYDGQFQSYLLEVNSLRRADLRAILEPFYRRYPAGNYLFIFTTDYGELAFVSPQRLLPQGKAEPKLRLRILQVDRDHVYHTDLEVLSLIRLGPGERSPESIWQKHLGSLQCRARYEGILQSL